MAARANCLTDVPGLSLGHATDARLATGVSVVRPHAPAAASVDVRGGGPATRETDLLRPEATVDRIHALTLSGGSAYGLDAAGGVVDGLRAAGAGFEVAGQLVPIVPGAAIFDLTVGAGSDWGDAPPYRALAGRALDDAVDRPGGEGNVGAGLGATAGALKGGLGTASAIARSGATVAALVVCNSFGQTVMPGTDTFWAFALEEDGELGGQVPAAPARPVAAHDVYRVEPGTSTTLAVIATDAELDKARLARVAAMAHAGLARAIRPAHGPLDGDVVFALSTARRTLHDPLPELTEVGTLAADCLARACARGVYAAEPLHGWPSYKSRHASP